MMLFFCFLGTTVFLNIYIALVSNEYSKVKDNIRAHHARFRITYIIRVLLRREAYGTLIRGICCKSPAVDNESGYWICVPRRRFDEEYDDEHELEF